MQKPKDQHQKAVKRIQRYLERTRDYGLSLKACNNLNITAYCDADWAADIDDRKSVTGYCIYIRNNLVSWCSKKQTTISRSSTEAEYKSVGSATVELICIQSILSELKVKPEHKPILWCDNQSIIYMSANPVLHSRTKHLEIDFHFVREQVLQGKL